MFLARDASVSRVVKDRGAGSVGIDVRLKSIKQKKKRETKQAGKQKRIASAKLHICSAINESFNSTMQENNESTRPIEASLRYHRTLSGLEPIKIEQECF